MPYPISFGIELEFNLAYIIPTSIEDIASSEASQDTRKLIFVRPISDERLAEEQLIDPSFSIEGTHEFAAQHHIAELLHSNGLPVNLRTPSAVSMDKWQVDKDNTVHPPEEGDEGYEESYSWVPIEIKTPALEFLEESLRQVREVCKLITETYVTNINETAGLHVHIGHFDLAHPFPLDNLKTLISFLYVFEPQISSLMPAYRQNHQWGASMQDRCQFVADYAQKFDLIQGVDVPNSYGKRNNVNFAGVEMSMNPSDRYADGMRHTIEFRQWPGCLDGETISHWVTILASIIKFVENGDPINFFESLLIIAKAENWEAMGDANDELSRLRFGPPPAEESFTIIDLLNWIGCTDQAVFFEGKWTAHRRTEPRRLPEPPVVWKTPEPGTEDDEIKRQESLKKLWMVVCEYKAFRDTTGTEDDGWDFDLEADFWPEHEDVEPQKQQRRRCRPDESSFRGFS